MKQLKHIKIGPEQDDWIEWVEFKAKDTEPIDIDPIILEKKEFWDKLETECVKECCGFDAFSFYPKSITTAKTNEVNFEHYLDGLKKHITTSESSIFISRYLNQLVHKTTLLNLLDHIKRIND